MANNRRPVLTQDNITTIDWYTLPRNGNGGAAITYLRGSTNDSSVYDRAGYLLAQNRLPRYPMPCKEINGVTFQYLDTTLYGANK